MTDRYLEAAREAVPIPRCLIECSPCSLHVAIAALVAREVDKALEAAATYAQGHVAYKPEAYNIAAGIRLLRDRKE